MLYTEWTELFRICNSNNIGVDPESVAEWAYIDDIMAALKALDVTITRLEALAECSFQGSEHSVKLGVTVTAQAALQDIETIMNGGTNGKNNRTLQLKGPVDR